MIAFAIPGQDISAQLTAEQLFNGEVPDLGTISDAEMISAGERYFDRQLNAANLVVSRPANGNILISTKPQFGA
jgi:hypothetical protein